MEPELLRRLLNSIAVQSFDDYEVIITDDSVDSRVSDVVAEFARDGRIKYFKNVETKGSPGNWNEAMRYATGLYVKIMHHDDWFRGPGSLGEFVRLMDENPDVNLGFCAAEVVDENGYSVSTYTPSPGALEQLARDPCCLFHKVAIGAPSVTILKNGLGILFDTKVKWVVDIDFYIRLLMIDKKFIFYPTPLVCVSAEAPNRVTNACVTNREVNLFEYFYLLQKIETGKLSDYKYLKFIVRKMVSFDVTSKRDLTELGVKEPLSRLIRTAILLSICLLKLKRPAIRIRDLFRWK